MAELSSEQIDDLRDNYIRDRWTDYAAGPPAVNASGLSEYNRSRKTSFFSDDQLVAIDLNVSNDWSQELEGVHQVKYDERIQSGDIDAAATSAADELAFQARARLISVTCRQMMMNDPGFRASLTVGEKSNAEAIEKQWAASNRSDLNWVRSRSGIVIEVER